jgi:hypothetical protein
MDNLLTVPEVTDTGVDSALFEDMGILPAQFYPARRDAGEMESIKKLMTAILVDALQCYQTGRHQNVKRVKALEACTWIFGSYADFPFSFTNVCDELGVSPDRLRQQLRESDKQAPVGARPKTLRRPPIRTPKVQGQRRRSRRSSPRRIQAGETSQSQLA